MSFTPDELAILAAGDAVEDSLEGLDHWELMRERHARALARDETLRARKCDAYKRWVDKNGRARCPHGRGLTVHCERCAS